MHAQRQSFCANHMLAIRTCRTPVSSLSPLSFTKTRSLRESRMRSRGSWTPWFAASIRVQLFGGRDRSFNYHTARPHHTSPPTMPKHYCDYCDVRKLCVDARMAKLNYFLRFFLPMILRAVRFSILSLWTSRTYAYLVISQFEKHIIAGGIIFRTSETTTRVGKLILSC